MPRGHRPMTRIRTGSSGGTGGETECFPDHDLAAHARFRGSRAELRIKGSVKGEATYFSAENWTSECA